MRYRLTRTIRFLISLVLLVLLVPFLMTKLDSSTRRSMATEPRIDDSNVKMNLSLFFIVESLFLFSWNV